VCLCHCVTWIICVTLGPCKLWGGVIEGPKPGPCELMVPCQLDIWRPGSCQLIYTSVACHIIPQAGHKPVAPGIVLDARAVHLCITDAKDLSAAVGNCLSGYPNPSSDPDRARVSGLMAAHRGSNLQGLHPTHVDFCTLPEGDLVIGPAEKSSRSGHFYKLRLS
jgi:hypothetical protein